MVSKLGCAVFESKEKILSNIKNNPTTERNVFLIRPFLISRKAKQDPTSNSQKRENGK
jgi:hypothetical protein